MELPLPASVEEPDMPLPALPLPEVLRSEAPLLLEPLEDMLLPELLLDAGSLIVAPEVPDEPEVAESCWEVDGVVVVVVLVVWPNAMVAVPMRESRMAIGNFFMLTPSD